MEWKDENLITRSDHFSKLNLDTLGHEVPDSGTNELGAKECNERGATSQNTSSQRQRKSAFRLSLEACFPCAVGSRTNFLRPCQTEVSSVAFSKPVEDLPRSLAVHPAEQKLLCAVGYENGKIALCAGDDHKICVSHQHESVSGLAFNDFTLLSSGLDGSLRKTDLTAASYTPKIFYRSGGGISIDAMACSEDNNVWLGQSDGNLVHVDLRERSSRSFQVTYYPVTSLCLLKSLGLICATSNFIDRRIKNAAISVWDIRMLPWPVAQAYHDYGVEFVEFHPNHLGLLVASCSDDIVRIYRYEAGFDHLKIVASLPESTRKFRPVWHPSYDKACLVGNNNGDLLLHFSQGSFGNFERRLLNNSMFLGKNNLLAHHPTLPIAVGASFNSSDISVMNFKTA